MALVERGGSLWLNCSTNCPRPERGGLETSLRRNGTQRGLRWLARQLVDIREPETQPVCFFRCARRTLQARGLIRTFREFSAATLLPHYLPSLPGPAPWVMRSSPSGSFFWIPKPTPLGPWVPLHISKNLGSSLAERPDRVELMPLPAWQPVGQNFTLSCRVPGAGPRGSLTVTLLRGARELVHRSFSGESPRARGAVLTAAVLARREDHGANFSCRAELDLRPHGLGLFENRSAPRMLRTFGEWVWGSDGGDAEGLARCLRSLEAAEESEL